MTTVAARVPLVRARLGSVLPSTLKSVGLVVLAMLAILVVLPAALVAAGT